MGSHIVSALVLIGLGLFFLARNLGWIDTYQDEAFGDSVREVLTITDAAHDAASSAVREELREAYLKAVRYEWMFWDSAYRLEAWPV